MKDIKIIHCNVDVCDNLIRITDNGGKSYRWYTQSELLDRGGEGFIGEGKTYKHYYWFVPGVPVEVIDLLGASV